MATYLNEHIQKINQDAPIDRKQVRRDSVMASDTNLAEHRLVVLSTIL